jgi:hypothetical protein
MTGFRGELLQPAGGEAVRISAGNIGGSERMRRIYVAVQLSKKRMA